MGTDRRRMSLKLNRTALLAVAVLTAGAGGAGAREPLDVDQRVACGQAVEEVRWRHRIWPAENPDPKPPLDVIFADGFESGDTGTWSFTLP